MVQNAVVTPLPNGFSGLKLPTLQNFSKAMTGNSGLGMVAVSHASTFQFAGQLLKKCPEASSSGGAQDDQANAIRGLLQGLSECQALCTQWHADRLEVPLRSVKIQAKASMKHAKVDRIQMDVSITCDEDIAPESVVEVFEEARRYSPLQSCVRSTAEVQFGATFQPLGPMPTLETTSQKGATVMKSVRSIQEIDFDLSCDFDLASDGTGDGEAARPDTFMSSLSNSLTASLRARQDDQAAAAQITSVDLDFRATADMHPVLSDLKDGKPTEIRAKIHVKGYGSQEDLEKEWNMIKKSSPVLCSIQSQTPIRYSLLVNGEGMDHCTAENTFQVEL